MFSPVNQLAFPPDSSPEFSAQTFSKNLADRFSSLTSLKFSFSPLGWLV